MSRERARSDCSYYWTGKNFVKIKKFFSRADRYGLSQSTAAVGWSFNYDCSKIFHRSSR
jgi:hypothetical protein